jgi:serine/threonine-protein kinase HipA
MTSEREVHVYIHLPGTLDTVPAALLRVQTLPDGTLIGRFRYGDRYLKRKEAVCLDPFQLPLDTRVYEFTRLKGIPGAVRDASPDAWGRRVIEYKLQRGAGDLQEIDYLLHGPQDGAGYLSFGLKVEPPAPKRAYNRTHQLPELIAATQAIEEGRPVAAQLLEQMDPGTSMGGARPKATIEDSQCLWLGKFPSSDDRLKGRRMTEVLPPVLDALQLVRTEAVHKGFLHQHHGASLAARGIGARELHGCGTCHHSRERAC